MQNIIDWNNYQNKNKNREYRENRRREYKISRDETKKFKNDNFIDLSKINYFKCCQKKHYARDCIAFEQSDRWEVGREVGSHFPSLSTWGKGRDFSQFLFPHEKKMIFHLWKRGKWHIFCGKGRDFFQFPFPHGGKGRAFFFNSLGKGRDSLPISFPNDHPAFEFANESKKK